MIYHLQFQSNFFETNLHLFVWLFSRDVFHGVAFPYYYCVDYHLTVGRCFVVFDYYSVAALHGTFGVSLLIGIDTFAICSYFGNNENSNGTLETIKVNGKKREIFSPAFWREWAMGLVIRRMQISRSNPATIGAIIFVAIRAIRFVTRLKLKINFDKLISFGELIIFGRLSIFCPNYYLIWTSRKFRTGFTWSRS